MNYPLKWHGGKQGLADWIIEQFPEHTHYVEPYAGGLGVLLKKPLGASEVVNDLNGALSNFWAVLAHPEKFEELVRRAEATPFSEKRWNETHMRLFCRVEEGVDSVDLALDFFVLVRQSRQGLCKDFATLSRNRTRRGMNEQASSWLSAIEGLRDAHERLKGVVVLSRPALDVIRQQDGPNTLFYLDPPYLHETRTTTADYAHEMSEDEHIELLLALKEIEGKFILSGYPSEIYSVAADDCGWRVVSKEVKNHASGKSSKPTRVETLWMNF